MSDVLKSKDVCSVQVCPFNADQSWEIAMTVLRWGGCETIEEHHSSGYRFTTVGENFVSKGSHVGAWVEPINAKNTKITIVTK